MSPRRTTVPFFHIRTTKVRVTGGADTKATMIEKPNIKERSPRKTLKLKEWPYRTLFARRSVSLLIAVAMQILVLPSLPAATAKQEITVSGTTTAVEAGGVKSIFLDQYAFSMSKLSIIANVYFGAEHIVGCCDHAHRVKFWAITGAISGGFWGFLFGSGFFLIPGTGAARRHDRRGAGCRDAHIP
jgi:hypothetical protein